MDLEEKVAVETVTERRLHRVGACPVLEVTVTYPRLRIGEGEGTPTPADAERFNRAYARMAEAFLSWAEGEPARAASEAFLSMGAGAAYRFDRRLILCNMTADLVRGSRSQGVEFLRVVRRVSQGCRKGGVTGKILIYEDVWRVPLLTLVRQRPVALPIAADETCRMPPPD